ncbi:MAG TPA: hypothetical protein VNZ22_14485, partial [Bacillota bacterium]|nr:hypothetical protein [Bacillota bacterium]
GSGRVAVMRGPVVFALDKRVTQLQPGAGKGTLSAQGLSRAKAIQGGAGILMGLEVPFEVAGKEVTVRLCDYASAGSTWSADSMLRVWLPQPLDLEDPFAGVQQLKAQ